MLRQTRGPCVDLLGGVWLVWWPGEEMRRPHSCFARHLPPRFPRQRRLFAPPVLRLRRWSRRFFPWSDPAPFSVGGSMWWRLGAATVVSRLVLSSRVASARQPLCWCG
ncbi:hypothetical protein E2C01_066498 [Portunus trituberculatus]|uniref:Uncharacterized protein n=1 Tax=Portunus trituberculatus TaxID=210409 RepID=A0A5B7HH90_PORTR|nr:hypothetical protein [Portunus trituberculatus]